MKLVQRDLDIGHHDVGVDLRGGDAGVAKLFLDEAQVPVARLEKQARVGVSQAVNRELRWQAASSSASFEDVLQRSPAHVFPGDAGLQ